MTKKADSKLYMMASDLVKGGVERTQNYESLAQLVNDEIESYCALGVLGCMNKMIYVEEQEDEEYGVETVLIEPDESVIVNLYGLEDRLKEHYTIMFRQDNDSDNSLEVRNNLNRISNIIITLNDDGHCSFHDIANVLRDIAEKGIAVECDSEKRKFALAKVNADKKEKAELKLRIKEACF